MSTSLKICAFLLIPQDTHKNVLVCAGTLPEFRDGHRLLSGDYSTETSVLGLQL